MPAQQLPFTAGKADFAPPVDPDPIASLSPSSASPTCSALPLAQRQAQRQDGHGRDPGVALTGLGLGPQAGGDTMPLTTATATPAGDSARFGQPPDSAHLAVAGAALGGGSEGGGAETQLLMQPPGPAAAPEASVAGLPDWLLPGRGWDEDVGEPQDGASGAALGRPLCASSTGAKTCALGAGFFGALGTGGDGSPGLLWPQNPNTLDPGFQTGRPGRRKRLRLPQRDTRAAAGKPVEGDTLDDTPEVTQGGHCGPAAPAERRTEVALTAEQHRTASSLVGAGGGRGSQLPEETTDDHVQLAQLPPASLDDPAQLPQLPLASPEDAVQLAQLSQLPSAHGTTTADAPPAAQAAPPRGSAAAGRGASAGRRAGLGALEDPVQLSHSRPAARARAAAAAAPPHVARQTAGWGAFVAGLAAELQVPGDPVQPSRLPLARRAAPRTPRAAAPAATAPEGPPGTSWAAAETPPAGHPAHAEVETLSDHVQLSQVPLALRLPPQSPPRSPAPGAREPAARDTPAGHWVASPADGVHTSQLPLALRLPPSPRPARAQGPAARVTPAERGADSPEDRVHASQLPLAQRTALRSCAQSPAAPAQGPAVGAGGEVGSSGKGAAVQLSQLPLATRIGPRPPASGAAAVETPIGDRACEEAGGHETDEVQPSQLPLVRRIPLPPPTGGAVPTHKPPAAAASGGDREADSGEAQPSQLPLARRIPPLAGDAGALDAPALTGPMTHSVTGPDGGGSILQRPCARRGLRQPSAQAARPAADEAGSVDTATMQGSQPHLAPRAPLPSPAHAERAGRSLANAAALDGEAGATDADEAQPAQPPLAARALMPSPAYAAREGMLDAAALADGAGAAGPAEVQPPAQLTLAERALAPSPACAAGEEGPPADATGLDCAAGAEVSVNAHRSQLPPGGCAAPPVPTCAAGADGPAADGSLGAEAHGLQLLLAGRGALPPRAQAQQGTSRIEREPWRAEREPCSTGQEARGGGACRAERPALAAPPAVQQWAKAKVLQLAAQTVLPRQPGDETLYLNLTRAPQNQPSAHGRFAGAAQGGAPVGVRERNQAHGAAAGQPGGDRGGEQQQPRPLRPLHAADRPAAPGAVQSSTPGPATRKPGENQDAAPAARACDAPRQPKRSAGGLFGSCRASRPAAPTFDLLGGALAGAASVTRRPAAAGSLTGPAAARPATQPAFDLLDSALPGAASLFRPAAAAGSLIGPAAESGSLIRPAAARPAAPPTTARACSPKTTSVWPAPTATLMQTPAQPSLLHGAGSCWEAPAGLGLRAVASAPASAGRAQQHASPMAPPGLQVNAVGAPLYRLGALPGVTGAPPDPRIVLRRAMPETSPVCRADAGAGTPQAQAAVAASPQGGWSGGCWSQGGAWGPMSPSEGPWGCRGAPCGASPNPSAPGEHSAAQAAAAAPRDGRGPSCTGTPLWQRRGEACPTCQASRGSFALPEPCTQCSCGGILERRSRHDGLLMKDDRLQAGAEFPFYMYIY